MLSSVIQAPVGPSNTYGERDKIRTLNTHDTYKNTQSQSFIMSNTAKKS